MSAATTAADLATPPDPQPDRPGKPVPERIAEILAIAGILAEYGRHLAATIEHRAIWRGFATIAQFFGTAAIPRILPYLQRGIMRAVALHRVLQQRAARGRDLVVLARRDRSRRKPPQQPEAAAQPPAALTAGTDPATPPAAPAPAAPPARRPGPEEELTLDNLPAMAQLEAEVRRRPIGRTIADICRDLGVAPTLCAGPFWNRLFMAMHAYRGSVGNLVLEMRRREKQLDREHWRYPNLGLPEETREGVFRVLGFPIGEPPVDPFRPAPASGATAAAPCWPVAAVATGPP